MKFRNLIVGSILFIYTISISASVKFYQLNFEQGLSQSTVNCIIKDSRGYFWFGTNAGLNKWDGYSFTVYNHVPGDTTSIGQGRINAIYEDKNEVLWVATSQGGLCRYISETDQFKNIIFDASNRNTNNFVVDIAPYKEQLLLATFTGELYIYYPEVEEYAKAELFNERNEPLPEGSIINGLSVTNDSTVWINTSIGAVKIKKLQEQDSYIFIEGDVLLKDKSVHDIFVDSENNIWIGTYSSGAYVFDSGYNKIQHYKPGKKDGSSVSHPNVRAFCEDVEGNIWIATNGGGINMYNHSTQKIIYYTHDPGNKHSIGSNIIYSLYADEDKNIWIGTYNGGISYTNFLKQQFNHIRSYGRIGDLTNNSVLSFCEVMPGEIWIGTDGGGINIYDKTTGKLSYFNINSKLNVITKLVNDGENKIYIGTYREGLFVYDLITGKLEHYKAGINPGDLLNNCIWDIAIDPEGDIWIGTLGGGLTFFNPEEKKFISYGIGEDKRFKGNYVSSMLADSRNRIWVGTYHDGLYRFDKSTTSFKKIKGEKSLKSNEVRVIFEDSTGRIWVGMLDGGLNLLIDEERGFETFTQENGLPGNSIQAIREDKKGNLWVSTNKGISRLTIEGDYYKFRNYTLADGLQSNEFNIHASLVDKSGQLYFGGVNGFNYFNPEDIVSRNTAGPVVISSFRVMNGNKQSDLSGLGIEKAINYSDGIQVDYNQSTFTIEYAMLDYTSPGKNTYKYKLIPFDKEWISAGNRRSATYTNLNPGQYEFQVKGINSQLVENSAITSLKIQVLPPLWKKAWFKFIMGTMLVLLLISVYRLRLRSFRIQGEILKKVVDDRTKELKSLNKVLEERNTEIYLQSEELKAGQKKLIAANRSLEEGNREIEIQKRELEKNRNNLEKTIRDRTFELEMAKKKAEESEQLKMAFLSNMSHEIRTPMNAIVGFASLLADMELAEDEKQEYVRQINVNSESLLLLIDDILDLSKIEANQLRISLEVFEINRFVHQVYINWKHLKTNNERQVEFVYSTELNDKVTYVYSDQQRIRQILNNLLDNAFKFTSKGKVELFCKLNQGNVEISVSDTGIGISEDDKNYIFDRFRKGEESSKKLYRGAGLGLTISHKLTELVNGKMWVDSIEGKGSMFYLSLPVYQSEEVEEYDESVSPESFVDIDLTGINILIAEDEEANFFYLSGMLVKKGATVEHAADGEEAIKMSSIKDYHLILMDIKMPGMNGVEATKKIRLMFPEQIIIAQTAYARPEEEAHYRQNGFDGYITKPIKKDMLFHALKEHLYL